MEKPLKINMRKIIENFLNAYPMSPEEVLVVESVANGLDAKAKTINLKITKDLFAVEDNGKGMDKKEFEDNFAALAISSKEKGGGGIGFAGIGAKLYLAIPETEVAIESVKGQSSFSALLYPRGNDIVWIYNSGEHLLTHQGTYYEVKLRKQHGLNEKSLSDTVRKKYNAILLGWYGDKKITVNGKLVPAFHPQTEDDCDEPTTSKYGDVRFVYWLLKTPQPEWSGIHIVVHGKTIRSKEWFGFDYDLKPQFRDRIVGFILADPLDSILTTNKEDISKSTNPLLWSSIQGRAVRSLKEWLQKIHAFDEKEKRESEGPSLLEAMAQSILNQVLSLPELRIYNPFLGRQQSRTAVPSSDPNTGIAPVEGTQTTEGTERGERNGHGTPTEGPDAGKGFVEQPESDMRGRIANRRIRSGVLVKFSDEPGNEKECWLSGDVLVINTGHPNYRLAKQYAFETGHVTRCAFMELVERVHPQAKEYYDSIRQFYGSWSSLAGS